MGDGFGVPVEKDNISMSQQQTELDMASRTISKCGIQIDFVGVKHRYLHWGVLLMM